jgi:hypothetical protein
MTYSSQHALNELFAAMTASGIGQGREFSSSKPIQGAVAAHGAWGACNMTLNQYNLGASFA